MVAWQFSNRGEVPLHCIERAVIRKPNLLQVAEARGGAAERTCHHGTRLRHQVGGSSTGVQWLNASSRVAPRAVLKGPKQSMLSL
jgi:hypothetical protein